MSTWPASSTATRCSGPTRRARSCSTPTRWRRLRRPEPAVERAYAYWVGDGSRGQALGADGMRRVDDYLAPTVTLRRLLRHDVEDDRSRLIEASRQQVRALDHFRNLRRVEVVGPAGSGKSILAVERARRLARDGFRTLFVCFNQPLATAVLHEIESDPAPPDRRPQVTTFHRLCETLGQRAGVLGPRPDPPPRAWWDETLPGALDAAIDALPAERFHAIVVDEGQDFERSWLESLTFLLEDPVDDVLWIFHDPGQALFRDDHVAELGLQPVELFEDYRCPAPVSELASGFYHGPSEPIAVAPAGRPPRIVEAAARSHQPSMPSGSSSIGWSTTKGSDPGRSSSCPVGRRPRATSGVSGGSGTRSCGAGRSTTPAARSSCPPTRSPTSRRTSSGSRRSVASRVSSARSSSCASCQRPPSASTSSSTSA